MKPRKLLQKVKQKLDLKEEFEFWKLISDLEENTEFTDSKKGTIEENTTVNGVLELENGAIIKNGTRIEGSVFIGKNSVIGPNAYLRKKVVIGKKCHISNSEVKNSVILNNSNVPHFSYLGDSIIGENVNLGAGTKIANLRFDNKSVKVSINGKKIDSHRRKLGALINSNTKTGINSSINCGIIIGKNCFVYPGTIVKENLQKKSIKEF